MKHPVSKLGLMVMIAALMGACATSYQPVPPFTPANIDASGNALKTQNVVIVLDTSSSMEEGYRQWKKFDVATATVRNMAETIPANMGIKSGLRTFGHDPQISRESTMLIDDMGDFDKMATEKALATVTKAGGTSNLTRAIDGAAEDLAGLDGKHALIIVTDGKGMGMGPAASATAIKQTYGDNLCIYPIFVGDAAEGKQLMDELARIGGCGFAANADDLASGQQMADYVSNIFVGEMIDSDGDGVADAMDKCPGTPAGVEVDSTGCPLDSDGDGVPDFLDKCPGTPAGVDVDETGCPKTILGGGARSWTFNNITFDTSKANIKSSSYGILDEIAAALVADPQLKITVEGHADSTGEQAFNLDLSQRRAEAVVDYLVGKGVAPSRLSAKGYGEDRPVADNETREGRAKNRRVQLTRIKN